MLWRWVQLKYQDKNGQIRFPGCFTTLRGILTSQRACIWPRHTSGAEHRMPQSCHATNTCAMLNQLGTPPLSGWEPLGPSHAAISPRAPNWQIQCHLGSRRFPKAIVMQHSTAETSPFSHVPTWKLLNEMVKDCTDSARSCIMSGKWCSRVLPWSS